MSTNTSTRYTLAGRLLNALADRLRPTADTDAEAAGLTVVRLPDGGRLVYDPRLPDYAETRRRRMVRDGLDDTDRALMDPTTAAMLRATAARMATEPAGPDHRCSAGCPATPGAPCDLSAAGVAVIDEYAERCWSMEAWLPTPPITAHQATR